MKQALLLDKEEWPQPLVFKKVVVSQHEIKQFDYLKDLRDKKAKELSLDPSIIASKLALEKAAQGHYKISLLPWQQELLGFSVS